ncbi:hypothetical protein [Motilimonas sp. KMU-193]|uniref:hypothetical protein n=1 Tax=Motilimonas sp. KMU-193 TaxID=3388668 RepID=UPI00396B25BD
MQGSLILSSCCRVKFLTFIVNGIIGNDKDHVHLGAYLDVQNKKLILSNHLAVNSGVTASYVWDIEDLNIKQDCFFELPAKGFVNILNNLDKGKPVRMNFCSDNRVELASFVEPEEIQMTLFGMEKSAQALISHQQVKHKVRIMTDGAQSNYQRAPSNYSCGFRVSASLFHHLLQLVKDLSKQQSELQSRFGVTLRLTESSNDSTLTIFAQRSEWHCVLPMTVENCFKTDTSIETERCAYISMAHLSRLAGLLSAARGDIDVYFTDSHIVVKKRGWQCTFIQTHCAWDYRLLTDAVGSFGSQMLYPLAVEPLLDVLPVLNIANDEQTTRLYFQFCSDSSATYLSVNQDQVTSELTIELPICPSVLKDPISLNLFALNKVLGAFQGSKAIRWGFDLVNRRMIFQEGEQGYSVVLALGCSVYC